MTVNIKKEPFPWAEFIGVLMLVIGGTIIAWGVAANPATGLLFVVCFVLGILLAAFVFLHWLTDTYNSDARFPQTMGMLLCAIICAGIILL